MHNRISIFLARVQWLCEFLIFLSTLFLNALHVLYACFAQTFDAQYVFFPYCEQLFTVTGQNKIACCVYYISSVPWPIGSSGGHEGRFCRDPHPAFSTGGPYEQFLDGQGCTYTL